MCGLAGIMFGEGTRSAQELRRLRQLFTELLVVSRRRGPHATGIAWINRDGEHRLFKRPVPAETFVEHKAFADVLARVDNRTTVLLGHTRWRTRGDEHINRNNHPIRAADVVGTHNGTIYNADALFERFRFPRYAQVDSEVVFRIAANAMTRRGRIDVRRMLTLLKHCRGQITAAMSSRREPQTTLILKGNNPLECRWPPLMRVVMYASSASYLDAVLADERGWSELSLPAMTLFTFRADRLDSPEHRALKFQAMSTEESVDVRRWRQPDFYDF
jgi:amidophosphoribosyltransferase